MRRVQMMTVRGMRMVSRRLVFAGTMMLSCFAMMLRRVFMVFSSLLVQFTYEIGASGQRESNPHFNLPLRQLVRTRENGRKRTSLHVAGCYDLFMTYGEHSQRPTRKVAVLVLRLQAAERKTDV